MAGDYEDLYDLENLDDDDLREVILDALREYPDIDADRLDIEVEDGFVLVVGRIGTEQELQEIEHILTDVVGVGNYSNELVVDELMRAEYAAGADDAVAEDETVESALGEEGETTEPTAEHSVRELEGESYGTHDMQRAIERGEAYEAPDRPVQEGSWSEERH